MSQAGKWVQIWRRQRNGEWRVAAEIWNSDRPVGREGAGTEAGGDIYRCRGDREEVCFS